MPLALRMVRDSAPRRARRARHERVRTRGRHRRLQARRHVAGGPCRLPRALRHVEEPHRHAALRAGHPAVVARSVVCARVSQIAAGLALFSKTPVLVCWGERDFVFTPAVLEHWLRRWPHAEVHRFADCGHYVLEDAGRGDCRARATLPRAAPADVDAQRRGHALRARAAAPSQGRRARVARRPARRWLLVALVRRARSAER